MEQRNLEVGGREWAYIKDRVLGRGKIYRSLDGTQYMHTGSVAEVGNEANFIEQLHGLNFPVPRILSKGEIGGINYYIEESVGDMSFGEKFRHEYTLHQKVTGETFEGFCNIACQFLEAQLNNPTDRRSEIREGVHLSNVLQENPDLRDKIFPCISMIETNLQQIPLVLTHGDFSPRNTFTKGVIDFEHRFIAPVGYDVLTGITIQRFWDFKDSDGETQLDFDVESGQVADYFRKLDNIAEHYKIGQLSRFADDFVVLKAIWSLAYEKQFASQTGNNLKRNFRKAVLVYCMDQYMNGRPVDTSSFKKFGQQ